MKKITLVLSTTLIFLVSCSLEDNGELDQEIEYGLEKSSSCINNQPVNFPAADIFEDSEIKNNPKLDAQDYYIPAVESAFIFNGNEKVLMTHPGCLSRAIVSEELIASSMRYEKLDSYGNPLTFPTEITNIGIQSMPINGFQLSGSVISNLYDIIYCDLKSQIEDNLNSPLADNQYIKIDMKERTGGLTYILCCSVNYTYNVYLTNVEFDVYIVTVGKCQQIDL